MKWMNTKELVSLLKRFPNEEVEVVDYQDGSLASALFGMKADGEKYFRLTWDGETKTYSEAEVLRSYGNRYWKIVSSLFLRSEHERQIALRMVEELGLLGCLDDIIAEHGLDNVRVCEHCHRLMDEGWLVDDVRTFCSDECLQIAFPDIRLSELLDDSHDECFAYWTKWEE